MVGYCNVPVGREGISARIQLFYRGEKYDEQQLVVTENPDMWAVFPLPEEADTVETPEAERTAAAFSPRVETAPPPEMTLTPSRVERVVPSPLTDRAPPPPVPPEMVKRRLGTLLLSVKL